MNNRRDFLKASGLFAGISIFPKLQLDRGIRPSDVILGHNEHRYRVNKNWGLLDAGKNPVNDCHEFAEDSKGRLFMITNETKNNILIYDKSGKLLDSWGNKYIGGHGLSIFAEKGEEYLLICDPERHQVIKTDLKGRELLVLDYPKETGVYEYATQFKPTETAINPLNGDFYVADGYGSNYIIQYNAKGQYIRHFGGKTSDYADDKFNVCHGVLVDTSTPQATLLITDRINQSFKRFTLDGQFIKRYHFPGSYVCRPVKRGKTFFAACYRSGSLAWNNSGYLQVFDNDLQVISTPGGSKADYQNGQLQLQSKNDPEGIFMHPHDVFADADENLYVAQWNSQKTYPVKLERI